MPPSRQAETQVSEIEDFSKFHSPETSLATISTHHIAAPRAANDLAQSFIPYGAPDAPDAHDGARFALPSAFNNPSFSTSALDSLNTINPWGTFASDGLDAFADLDNAFIADHSGPLSVFNDSMVAPGATEAFSGAEFALLESGAVSSGITAESVQGQANDNRIRCDFPGCSATFGRIYELGRHKGKHDGTELSCEHCDFKHYRKDKILDHKRKHHPSSGQQIGTVAKVIRKKGKRRAK